MKYIGKYTDSSEVQTALNEEVLGKPYVALVGGVLDYNTLDVEEPVEYMGSWTMEEGTYNFQILDSDGDFWENVEIGTILAVHPGQTSAIDVPVYLKYSLMYDYWELVFDATDAGLSDYTTYQFYEGTPDEWDCQDFFVAPGVSDASVRVNWDGEGTFTFYSGDDESPLSMDTIDPEREEEPEIA